MYTSRGPGSRNGNLGHTWCHPDDRVAIVIEMQITGHYAFPATALAGQPEENAALIGGFERRKVTPLPIDCVSAGI